VRVNCQASLHALFSIADSYVTKQDNNITEESNCLMLPRFHVSAWIATARALIHRMFHEYNIQQRNDSMDNLCLL
jgi:uncharacterized FlgJ-related protein